MCKATSEAAFHAAQLISVNEQSSWYRQAHDVFQSTANKAAITAASWDIETFDSDNENMKREQQGEKGYGVKQIQVVKQKGPSIHVAAVQCLHNPRSGRNILYSFLVNDCKQKLLHGQLKGRPLALQCPYCMYTRVDVSGGPILASCIRV